LPSSVPDKVPLLGARLDAVKPSELHGEIKSPELQNQFAQKRRARYGNGSKVHYGRTRKQHWLFI